ncbi:glycosyltransferase [Phormidium sp. LEGE 05292]|uniref:glycosyltransferase n=1 Tax=[Phormidium] sp. LEGE 05292 TaxID=767427 RepID=UPI00187ED1AE|nr:glycosyltransferase [Phormidium sp. LEGE 05292]MBE9225635.1 glycosyltransferase [Phormidium sp. LEGE 05292]
MAIANFPLLLSFLSLIIWIILLVFRGQFWRCNQLLPNLSPSTLLQDYPAICAVIPARNEAQMILFSLRSLFQQSYPGSFTIVLVDDNSTDNTAIIAQELAKELNKTEQLHIISGAALPAGWSGKLWAMEQGIRYAETLNPLADYLLLTDADIQHHTTNLDELIAKAKQENLDLVSLMVLLRCESFWEKLLIPAFVFFFQKLYPFPLVNNPNKSIAAAAGGCILIKRETLTKIGGIERVKQALIDDCALAAAVKNPGKIWLGLTQSTRSLRPYPSLESIWDMVARTAYTQLNYSPFLLLGTVIGMTLVYLVPPLAVIGGLLTGDLAIALTGLITWLLMAIAYFPTIKLYNCSPIFAFCLPIIALLYNLMTIDSAWRHWRGKGGAWKGRVYPTINS